MRTKEQLIRDIKDLASELGAPDVMPKTNQLQAKFGGAISSDISQFGGIRQIAFYAGLDYQTQRAPKSKPTDIPEAVVVDKIRLLAEELGTSVMPKAAELTAAYGYTNALFTKYGGIKSLAMKAGLSANKRETYIATRLQDMAADALVLAEKLGQPLFCLPARLRRVARQLCDSCASHCHQNLSSTLTILVGSKPSKEFFV
jgi:hypothetical protein